jgi:hypothetical protein
VIVYLNAVLVHNSNFNLQSNRETESKEWLILIKNWMHQD